MPQHPKLRKKNVGNATYWYTEAGGPTYFGNVEDVPYTEAKKLFAAHTQSLLDEKKDSKEKGFTAGDLIEVFLAWIKKHRSHSSYTSKRIYCSRFGDFKIGNNKIAVYPADKIKASDLEAFLGQMEEEDFNPQTRLHAETAIRHCWNWGTKHPSPTPYLPASYRPFASVERTHVPRKALTEADLITPSEIESLFTCGEYDLDQFRRHGLVRTIERKGIENLRRSGDFTQLLKCYYHTGARTDELASCEVGDFLPRTSQIILGRHKRSRTQRQPTIRHITLNADALAIFDEHTKGKQKTDKLFLNQDGRPWTVRNLAKHFDRVKDLASALKGANEKKEMEKRGEIQEAEGETKPAIREEITMYDFRHLWISEALMAGNDIVTVARMAGTSIAMIERVYGHFSNQHLHEAQKKLDESRAKARISQASASDAHTSSSP
jgi:site-specific recombinase XerD